MIDLHTPGTWTATQPPADADGFATGPATITCGDTVIATVADGLGYGEQAGNACLIASAPRLYDAMRHLQTLLAGPAIDPSACATLVATTLDAVRSLDTQPPAEAPRFTVEAIYTDNDSSTPRILPP